MFDKPAPIILFVYNRLWHTRQTVEALQRNELAKDSDLIIYADGARASESSEGVKGVKDYIKTVTGFKSVTIVERARNWGLANNIIEGVTEVVNRYGKVIVLEDDIVTSPVYLNFMNQALDAYEGQKKVWHISGWNYPIKTDGMGDAFLWRVMNCWGWATWADRWQHFDKNPELLMQQWTKKERYRFDLDGSGIFWNQVESNALGKINTWAIFWYATIFKNDGLCVNPSVSYVENVGNDGTGVHCGVDTSHSVSELNKKSEVLLPQQFSESEGAVMLIKQFYKKRNKPFMFRLFNKVSRSLSGKNVFS